jgi:hypothetical protein
LDVAARRPATPLAGAPGSHVCGADANKKVSSRLIRRLIYAKAPLFKLKKRRHSMKWVFGSAVAFAAIVAIAPANAQYYGSDAQQENFNQARAYNQAQSQRAADEANQAAALYYQQQNLLQGTHPYANRNCTYGNC